jgi:hypothetical protein
MAPARFNCELISSLAYSSVAASSSFCSTTQRPPALSGRASADPYAAKSAGARTASCIGAISFDILRDAGLDHLYPMSSNVICDISRTIYQPIESRDPQADAMAV